MKAFELKMEYPYFFALIIGLVVQVFIVKNMKYPYGGSDHAYHYKMIRAIKNAHHSFFVSQSPAYPKLYHFICSFFPDDFLLKRANYINYIVTTFSFCVFIVFIYVCSSMGLLSIDVLDVLLIALLFATMPIIYPVWNAKFMGLSARSFGLFLNMCYSIALFFYLIYENVYWLPVILLFIFLQLIASQFAYQFTIFSSIFIFISTGHFEILILIACSILLLFILNYKYAKRFLYAQFNHKRNYSKFMIHDTQFKQRYSIWRDFIYDFWIKKDKNYVLNNPVLEVFIGALPSCLILFYYWISMDRNNEVLWVLYLMLASSFFAFFVTSLRVARFLGEPQRYIEFGIPFACILGIVLLPTWSIVLLIVINIIILKWYKKSSQFHRQLPEHIKIREEMIEYLRSNFDEKYKNLVCNDSEILRHFYISKYDSHLPDYSAYYKNREEYLSIFYKGDYGRISPSFVADRINKCGYGTLIVYTNMLKYYDETEILPMLNNINLIHLRDIGKFRIFRFDKEEK